MSPVTTEHPVALEHLDDYLKTIVKMKIREFVHLSPWFNDIPSIDLHNYMRLESVERYSPMRESPLECPNTHHRTHVRRRAARTVSF